MCRIIFYAGFVIGSDFRIIIWMIFGDISICCCCQPDDISCMSVLLQTPLHILNPFSVPLSLRASGDNSLGICLVIPVYFSILPFSRSSFTASQYSNDVDFLSPRDFKRRLKSKFYS